MWYMSQSLTYTYANSARYEITRDVWMRNEVQELNLSLEFTASSNS